MIGRKNIILILISIIFIGLIWLAAFFFFFPPKVKTLSPKSSSTNVKLESDITITFNKPVIQKTLDTFHISPQSCKIQPVGTTSITGNSVIFKTEEKVGLTPNCRYEVTITPYGLLGKEGDTIKYYFTTAEIKFDLLTQKQKELILNNQDYLESGKTKNADLDKLLPFENEYFYMVWISTTEDENDYTILLKGNQEESKQRAILWLKEKGIDSNNLNINYSRF